ncbi:hypothetical protein [Nostocoides sp. HKS02]|uniref:hypothetical protein n=1 Tax=Nostocoides sp. HKS02 TaxID=1813880 RepID=UPI0012B456B3|nr:hypothetical protein [Tetrasphaera sp. HKS02]QGN58780.1 hypothetical protein GKE56_13840 [Tetrasphaera sp. HKS02]
MSLLPLTRRRHEEPVIEPVERGDVREYRYVLATADFATLSRLHCHALLVLDPLVRANILRTAQQRLLSGRDLTVDDPVQLAHLVTVGEVRIPGILRAGLSEPALIRLAHAVVRGAVAEGVMGGYDAWDGRDADQEESATRLTRHLLGHGVSA